MDLEEISKRIDARDDPDAIRAALGEKIMECLLARGEELSSWERVNFGIAIELLPTTWLRMTWTHVDYVCNVSHEVDRNRQPPESQPVPTLQELHAKLNDELASIRSRQQMKPKRDAS